MTRFSLLTVLLLAAVATCCYADDKEGKVKYRGDKCYMYRLTLADKRGTPFTLNRPEAYLSPKAVERRHRQGLAIDSTDLPVSPAYIRQIAATGASVVRTSKWNNTVLVWGKDRQLLESLDTLPFVTDVKKVWTSPDSITPATQREKLAGVINKWDTVATNPYGHSFAQTDMLNGIRLHAAGFTGSGISIAVMDGGFMNADKMKAFMTANITSCKDFAVPESKDIFGEMSHGTMVLSIMAANLPGIFIGTAVDAEYILLRCEEHRTESLAEEDFWAAAAEYADSAGADIINSSLGFHNFDDEADNFGYSYLDGNATMISHTASMLADKGIVLVCSAGNDGMETWKKIDFPGDAHNILTVGAVSANKVNASFSAVGPTADGRVKPDVMAMGNPAAVITGRGTVGQDVGTSFSTPIVAGLVACLWQALPAKTAKEIIEIVRQSGNNSATPDNVYGYGVPDFWQAYVSNIK